MYSLKTKSTLNRVFRTALGAGALAQVLTSDLPRSNDNIIFGFNCNQSITNQPTLKRLAGAKEIAVSITDVRKTFSIASEIVFLTVDARDEAGNSAQRIWPCLRDSTAALSVQDSPPVRQMAALTSQ